MSALNICLLPCGHPLNLICVCSSSPEHLLVLIWKCYRSHPDTYLHCLQAGVCDCQHNTQGRGCSECQPLYNQGVLQHNLEGDGSLYTTVPWMRGVPSSANPCRKCQCYGHADACEYQSTAVGRSLDTQGRLLGGGVCTSCRDHTAGINCETCQATFFRDPATPRTATDACQPCDCFTAGAMGGSADCVRLEDNNLDGLAAGQCYCKANVEPGKCMECKDGFFNLQSNNALGCDACACDALGSASQTCDKQPGGQCPCLYGTEGRDCSQCKVDFYGFGKSVDTGCR